MANLRGLFGRPAAAPVAQPPAPQPGLMPTAQVEPRDDLTPVLDCLGAMLQSWSKHPILLPGEDCADAERIVAEWQRHATLGTPISGVHAPDLLAGPVHARDWTALTALAGERRRAEAANVGENLGDLQRAVWATVSSLARVAGEDATSDAVVEQQLSLLRACAQRGDTAAAMRELPAALQAITQALAARQSSAVLERVAMAARVESLGRALSASEDAARTDPLTGAGTRLRFVETMQRALALMTLSGAQASLLALDVDDLKGINDTLGHAAGDLAIKAVAKACWTVCTRPTDVLCRLGGDEFAVVMTNTDATAAASLADRLERRMQEVPVTLADGVVRLVTASIGFAAAKPGETVDAWIARADKSLYDVKHERG
ncbi:MAG: GGDEF domain-containing protein [Gemmatimonadaceae bacterium]|nr:GGDEF domain-containing protein [Gemmatimonadaceae bacterium]